MNKLLSLSAAALVATAGVLSAATPNQFSVGQVQAAGSVLNLGDVATTEGGVLEIYDYASGQRGAILATKHVAIGQTEDLTVALRRAPQDASVLVVLNTQGDDDLSQVLPLNSAR